MNTAQFVLGTDDLMTLKELADVPEVKRARLTYWRIRNWVFVGLNGHKLPTVRIGGVRYTTVEKVLRFATECPARDHIESQDVGLEKWMVLPEHSLSRMNAISIPPTWKMTFPISRPSQNASNDTGNDFFLTPIFLSLYCPDLFRFRFLLRGTTPSFSPS